MPLRHFLLFSGTSTFCAGGGYGKGRTFDLADRCAFRVSLLAAITDGYYYVGSVKEGASTSAPRDRTGGARYL